MAKRVAVIDLGSNSIRMVIFERTSRLGFYILQEYKIKARLGEGAYENGGILQPAAMDNVFYAFKEFKHFIKIYKVNKVLCAGTSALRDAPNANIFINRIKSELGFGLKTISGKMEAFYGGVAALNLLSPLEEATTIDIGGGSTELAKISNGKIVNMLSLNVGTVRLKELFFDKKKVSGASKFINAILEEIPDEFMSSNIISIGGSLRAISNAIMQLKNHPLKIMHNFSYEYQDYADFIEKLSKSPTMELKNFPIKKDRYDTIREGAMIFLNIAKRLETKTVYTSGAGVREGIFLTNLFMPSFKFPKVFDPMIKSFKFPNNFNPSLKSLQDRFLKTSNANISKYASVLFNTLKPIHKINEIYCQDLIVAAKLFDIGCFLGFYSSHSHSSYIVRNGLNYGYTHEQKALIAAIIEYQGKQTINALEIPDFLPNIEIIKWLGFLLGLAKSVSTINNVKFAFLNHTLRVSEVKDFPMIKDNIKKLIKPAIFAITFD